MTATTTPSGGHALLRHAAFRAKPKGSPPRNVAQLVEARARNEIEDGDAFIVSFVGPTPMAGPHVFVDAGKRYDWRFARGLHAIVAVRAGIDARQTLGDLFKETRPYPTVIDLERQVVASLVDRAGGGLQLWPRRRGSDAWKAVFG